MRIPSQPNEYERILVESDIQIRQVQHQLFLNRISQYLQFIAIIFYKVSLISLDFYAWVIFKNGCILYIGIYNLTTFLYFFYILWKREKSNPIFFLFIFLYTMLTTLIGSWALFTIPIGLFWGLIFYETITTMIVIYVSICIYRKEN